MNFTVRHAVPDDTPLILSFIRELAEYEKLQDDVTATEEILRKSLFEEHQAEVIFGEVDGTPISFAVYFFNFSTFSGKHGLYLEDFYVRPDYRGKGIGTRMFEYLAKLALDKDCASFRWWCLDRNKHSIAFYEKMGAQPMSDWTVHVIHGQALRYLSSCAKEIL